MPKISHCLMHHLPHINIRIPGICVYGFTVDILGKPDTHWKSVAASTQSSSYLSWLFTGHWSSDQAHLVVCGWRVWGQVFTVWSLPLQHLILEVSTILSTDICFYIVSAEIIKFKSYNTEDLGPCLLSFHDTVDDVTNCETLHLNFIFPIESPWCQDWSYLSLRDAVVMFGSRI